MIKTDAAIPQLARPYQGKPAGLISRFLASGVDLVIVVAVLVAMYAGWATLKFLLRPAKFQFPEPSILLIVVAGFAVLTLYLTLGWTMTGRTYGDHLMGLRVVDRGREHVAPASRAAPCPVVRRVPDRVDLDRLQHPQPLRPGPTGPNLRHL